MLDGINSAGRKNIVGQLDLFGMGDDDDGGMDAAAVRLPDVPEFSRMELMSMEREMTGLYLTGHPMDDYRDRAKAAGATRIGAILEDFSGEDGPQRFADGQQISLAGIVGSIKKRTTKNNSMMAYVTLEDDSGFMELIVFQRGLDNGGNYLQDNAAILVKGRISVRDEKEPQLMVDSIRPLSDLDPVATPTAAPAADTQGKKLFLKLRSTDEASLRHIDLLLEMFPGEDVMVQYFADLKKQRSTKCIIHPALIRELKERLGEENVVVK